MAHQLKLERNGNEIGRSHRMQRAERMVGSLARSVALIATAWMAVGCASSWPKDVNVSLDPSLNNGGAWKQVKVHLIGTSDAAKIRDLKKMSMSDYWQPDGR